MSLPKTFWEGSGMIIFLNPAESNPQKGVVKALGEKELLQLILVTSL
jgi:hypothetical protein